MQQTAIRVLEAAFVGYPVVDVERARRFYEKVLHLKPAMEFGNEGKYWLEYDLNGATLALSNMDGEWKPSGSGPALGLEVEDFDGAVETLKAEGVTFCHEPFDTPVCRMCVIADTEGNTLIIHKRK